jgi:hypothetical protein
MKVNVNEIPPPPQPEPQVKVTMEMSTSELKALTHFFGRLVRQALELSTGRSTDHTSIINKVKHDIYHGLVSFTVKD